MSAVDLLQALRDAGVVVSLNWDKVRLEGEVPGELLDLCRRHKRGLIELLAIEDFAAKLAAWEALDQTLQPARKVEAQAQVQAPQWSTADAALVAWLEAVAPEALPAGRTELRPGVTMPEPRAYLLTLRRDAAEGPRGPRARTGALQRDIEGLQAIAARSQAVTEPAQLRALEGGKAA